MKKVIKRKTTVKKFATGGTKTIGPKTWGPALSPAEMLAKVRNATPTKAATTKPNASKDKWGRPSTSKWYGFNPDTKKFEADKKGDPIREGFKTTTSKTTVSPKKDEVKTTTKTTTTKPVANTVSALWKEVTGTDWSVAKGLGLTDGSAKNNIALMKDLKSGSFDLGKRVDARHQKEVDKVLEATANNPVKLEPRKATELPGPERELATYRNGGTKRKTTMKKATPMKRKVATKTPTRKVVVKVKPKAKVTVTKKATPTKKVVARKTVTTKKRK